MPFSSRTALRAPSHPATHAAVTSRIVPSGCLSVAMTRSGSCASPTSSVFHCDRHALVAQRLAQQPLVVVLAQDQEEGIGTQLAPDVTQRDARGPPALRPHVGAGRALAELERPLDDAEMRVDLERAGLHAQRPRLERRTGVPVHDQRAHASPGELVGEHEPGRARSDDQNVGIHVVRGLPGSVHPRRHRGRRGTQRPTVARYRSYAGPKRRCSVGSS